MNLAPAGLPRQARLRRRADFAALKSSRGRLGVRSFQLRYAPNSAGVARLGLAISKQVSRRAVERNRLKRLVRESFRRVRHRLPAVDLVVMARAQAAGMDGAQLLAEIDELWGKLLSAGSSRSASLPH
ncbi:MAG TPA: ribonuclease P protein component [Rhodanobacter sp.]|jgi:ribonuclease P protein component|nr:ribonuclease P protein component [Rhodanobacter sp.]